MVYGKRSIEVKYKQSNNYLMNINYKGCTPQSIYFSKIFQAEFTDGISELFKI